jgi:hypothetical protein
MIDCSRPRTLNSKQESLLLFLLLVSSYIQKLVLRRSATHGRKVCNLWCHSRVASSQMTSTTSSTVLSQPFALVSSMTCSALSSIYSSCHLRFVLLTKTVSDWTASAASLCNLCLVCLMMRIHPSIRRFCSQCLRSFISRLWRSWFLRVYVVSCISIHILSLIFFAVDPQSCVLGWNISGLSSSS